MFVTSQFAKVTITVFLTLIVSGCEVEKYLEGDNTTLAYARCMDKNLEAHRLSEPIIRKLCKDKYDIEYTKRSLLTGNASFTGYYDKSLSKLVASGKFSGYITNTDDEFVITSFFIRVSHPDNENNSEELWFEDLWIEPGEQYSFEKIPEFAPAYERFYDEKGEHLMSWSLVFVKGLKIELK